MNPFREARRGVRPALVLLATLLASACANAPRPLYHWGAYQPQVYDYFKGDGQLPEQQILKLEADASVANGKGEALPPGFNAHLGLLYLKTGRVADAQQAFRTEEARFPESRPYMDFLMRNFHPKPGESGAAKSKPAGPAAVDGKPAATPANPVTRPATPAAPAKTAPAATTKKN